MPEVLHVYVRQTPMRYAGKKASIYTNLDQDSRKSGCAVRNSLVHLGKFGADTSKVMTFDFLHTERNRLNYIYIPRNQLSKSGSCSGSGS